MRACFLGQNVCALGYGVAMVQTLPAEEKPSADAPMLCEPPPGLKEAVPNRMFEDFKRQPHFS